MKLIDRLIERSANRCELCDKSLKSRVPAILKLYDSGHGIKQTENNCIVACSGKVSSFSDLKISQKILKIINNQKPISCSYKTTAGTKSPMQAANLRSFNAKLESRRSFSYLTPKANPRAPIDKRIKNPPPIFNKENNKKLTNYESQATNKNTNELQVRIKNWQSQLSSQTLPEETIYKLLEQSQALGLPNSFIQELVNAKNMGNYPKVRLFSVDKNGVVIFKN